MTPPYGTRFRTPRGWFTFKPEKHLCDGCSMDWLRNPCECAEFPGCNFGIWVKDGEPIPEKAEPVTLDTIYDELDIF